MQWSRAKQRTTGTRWGTIASALGRLVGAEEHEALVLLLLQEQVEVVVGRGLDRELGSKPAM
jgi:hypothetical protein